MLASFSGGPAVDTHGVVVPVAGVCALYIVVIVMLDGPSCDGH